LDEIAIITRAVPARILGLKRKGHLGPGADADITIYAPDSDRRRMFARPRYVIKNGVIVAADGDIREETFGVTYYVEPAFEIELLPNIREWFEQHYTISFRNYPVETIDTPFKVPCESAT
jgi:formylmethanofuran dehydrogenase subunit A